MKPAMSLAEFLEMLEEQIAFHGAELEKHINAREIVLRVPEKARLSPSPPSLSSPPISISHEKKKKTRKSTAPNPEEWRRVRALVLSMIEEKSGLLKAGDILFLVLGEGPHTKTERDRVYGVLKELRDKKLVILNEDHTYSYKKEEERIA